MDHHHSLLKKNDVNCSMLGNQMKTIYTIAPSNSRRGGGLQDSLEKALEKVIEADYPDVSWLGTVNRLLCTTKN